MRHALCIVALALMSTSAAAVPWVFKHDQFDGDLQQAANEVNGGQFYTQPGFVAGEAFGQKYIPSPEMFPLQVTGFDLILAAPPNASGPLYSNATIEIYNSDSPSADPGSVPIFSISTADLFNPQTQQFDFPLIGNYAISVDFGQGDPQDRPPLITSGNIWLMIRFTDASKDMSTEWDFQCAIFDFGGQSIGCGCQNVGTIHDNDITGKVNVMHIVQPLGQCSGNKGWVFMENVSNGSFTIDGDTILRLKADVASGPCEADCSDKDCGDDGCGGTCGSCGEDLTCHNYECVSCVPQCTSPPRQCGDDGCGGVCGICGGNETCGDDFFCHTNCTPQCNGKECGNDGCGGTCGTCTNGESCTAAGQCQQGCVSNCSGKECGDNGCGGSCGNCAGDEVCDDGECVDETPVCVPDCDGKECGSDGCGDTCGSCDDDETCDDGECKAEAVPPLEFEVTDVSPDSALAMDPTAISITGKGFEANATVKVGATDCTDVTVTGNGLISATVPGMVIGTYSVIVVNPDGEIATLVDGFTVYPKDLVTTKGKSDGCGGGPVGLMAGLGGLMVMWMRRRVRAR